MPANSRSPQILDVCLLAALPAAGTVAVRLLGGLTLVTDPWWSVTGAVAFALVLGLPALALVLGRGGAGLPAVLAIGVVIGVLPLLVFGTSAVAGLYLRSGAEAVTFALKRGVPLPFFGIVSWARVVHLEVQGLLIGLVSALAFWQLRLRSRH